MDDELHIGQERDIPQLIDRLRALVKLKGKARPVDWEVQVAPIVGLLSVDYPRQESEQIALTEQTLVTLAGMVGCKAAKKRVLSSRWIAAPPSVIQQFGEKDERKAAIKALSKIHSQWVLAFVMGELSQPEAKNVRGELIAWAASAAQTWEAVLNAVLQNKSALGLNLSQVIEGFAQVARSNRAESIPAGSSFLASLRRLLSELSLDAQGSGKEAVGAERFRMLANLAELLDVAITIDPRLALNPGLGDAFVGLLPEKGAPRSLVFKVEHVARRVASTLGVIYNYAEASARQDIARHSRSIAELSESFRKVVKTFVREEPSLIGLIEEPPRDIPSSLFPVEDALCSLIPEMDELAKRHSEDLLVEQTRMRVEALAMALDIQRLGKEGEIVDFDAFRHIFSVDPSKPPSRVRIERSGLVALRADGSQRVLLKAIVRADGN